MENTEFGSKVFDFGVTSPAVLSGVNIRRIFIPDGGATITDIRLLGSDTNVVSDYCGGGIMKAGELISAPKGSAFNYVAGSAGRINYELAS